MGLKPAGLRGSLRQISTGGVAIPDSAVAQYDATQETGFSDGDAIGTLTDFKQSNNLASGTGTYKTAVQNGKAVVRYNGSEGHYDTGFSLSQPVTWIAVVVSATQKSSNESVMSRADSNDPSFNMYWNSSNWVMDAGSDLNGSATTAPLILTGIFDGANSEIRENGTQTNSGNAGTNNMGSLNVGAINGNSTWFLDGDVGEAMVYDANLKSDGDLSDEESRLANKWGITI